jgi:hypothetical protein
MLWIDLAVDTFDTYPTTGHRHYYPQMNHVMLLLYHPSLYRRLDESDRQWSGSTSPKISIQIVMFIIIYHHQQAYYCLLPLLETVHSKEL